jgi:hypothetical protein
MEHDTSKDQNAAAEKVEEANIDGAIGEELTDEQLLQMAEGSCSWGANCNKGC